MTAMPLEFPLPPRLVLQDRLASALSKEAERGGTLLLLHLDRGDAAGARALAADIANRLATAGDPRVLVPLGWCPLDRVFLAWFSVVERRAASDPRSVAAWLASSLAPCLAARADKTRGCGIALFPRDGGDPFALLAAARRAARLARAGLVGWLPERPDAVEAGASLCKALAQGRLDLHYQPQVDAESGKVIGLEALARVRAEPVDRPERLLEAETVAGLDRVALWALGRVARDLGRWRDLGLDAPRTWVNLPLALLRSPALADDILDFTARSDCPGSAFGLELTEETVPIGIDAIGGQMARLRAAGLSLALDDFGRGFSAPFLLEALPLDVLKLDKTALAVDAVEGETLLRTSIALGRRHGLTVLAEGVERADQLSRLSRLGCHACQGFLFGPPVDADAIPALLRTEPGASGVWPEGPMT